MTCSKCECLVRVKNKLGYNLYYCGYKKYGVLKALSGLYINNEEYRKDSKTCKYYKGVRKMTDEGKIELKKLKRERNILKADVENLKNELIFLVTSINQDKDKVTIDGIVEELETILITYKE